MEAKKKALLNRIIEEKHKESVLSKEDIWRLVKQYTGSERMPDRRKAVIIFNSIANNYKDAALEWVKCNDTCQTQERCICSHEIWDNYVIQHYSRKTRLVVGMDCIEKFGNEDLTKEIQEEYKKRQEKRIGQTRKCPGCGNYYGNIDTWGIKCYPCVYNESIGKTKPIF